MKNYFVILILIFTSGCAFGPLVGHETARTVGDNHHEVAGGYGNTGAVFKWNYGITENWDLGLHWESLSIGIRTKYSFLNSPDGASVAVAGGVGESLGGSHYYGDLLVSYGAGDWEPYGILRAVHVTTDPLEVNDEDTDTFDFTIESQEYDYGQAMIGTRYWFNESWYLSGELSGIIAFSGLDVNEGVHFFSLALGYRNP